MHGFVIAGTNSGCGKTTVSIGLMALLKSMGNEIAPFKTGPDYIDPLFHREILGTPSYNLDSFMLPESAITYLFQKHTHNKDIAIVEGVMGMYDGMGVKAEGSTYQLSQLLHLPVVLVVNCKGLYQSVSAIVKGFATLKDSANVKGVILNHCPSEDYYKFLSGLIERDCKIKCIGYVPTNKLFALESRHLGLIQAEEVDHLTAKIDVLTQTLKKTIDVEKLYETCQYERRSHSAYPLPNIDLSGLHIGVAYDKAFRFYYQDNLELLEQLGAIIHYFSPLDSAVLPEKCNCLFIGGGYPEVFAEELSKNTSLLQEIKQVAQHGMPIYAECGGLMYLTEQIIRLDKKVNDMAGVFKASVQMTQTLQQFGYAQLSYRGVETRCHEFHRSKMIANDVDINYTLEYHLNKPEKNKEWQCGLKFNNCLAAYAHVHFYSNSQFFEQIVALWKKAII